MAVQWVQKFNVMGPQGPKGDQGPQGIQGGSTRYANIDVTANSDVAFSAISPSDGIKVGDVVIDTNGEAFPVASVNAEGSTAHVGASTGVNMRGPQGPQGPQGDPGKDGTGIDVKGSVGTESALPQEGNENGDCYLVSDTGKLAIWNGTRWVQTDSIQGPTGNSIRTTSQSLSAEGGTVLATNVSPQTGIVTGDSIVGTEGTVHTVTGVDSGNVTYGPTVIDVKGPKGETGQTGPAGADGKPGPGILVGEGAPSDPGVVGQMYFDSTTGDAYLYQDIQE